MKILVTGGAGYIGSHMVRALIENKHVPVVFDNLSMGHRAFIPAGTAFAKGDLRDYAQISSALKKHRVGAVMHFAACAFVGESMKLPMKYYENNVLGGVHLVKAMAEHGVRRLVFSSTCATYGEPKHVPISEKEKTEPVNPYGRSKLLFEEILKDLSIAGDLEFISLRYFNACGAHSSAAIGERHEPETHLIPNILRVASGRKMELKIFGGDHDTPDGTCVRDYVHVDDLAAAHLSALNALGKGLKSGIFNLGSGRGHSVMEIVRTAEKITGKKIKFKIASRRPGDPARLVADATKAEKVLRWKPARGLEEIIRSAWKWEQRECRRVQLSRRRASCPLTTTIHLADDRIPRS